MADPIRITNIVSASQGGTAISGVRSINITTNKGRVVPLLGEGNLNPTGSENLGNADFPVTTQLVFESDPATMLATLGAAKGDLVIIVKKDQGAGNQTITIKNHQFVSVGISQVLQDIGKPALNGVAHSESNSPNTLPISVA